MNPPSIWQRQFFPGVSLLRLFTWRMIRRYLFCLACLATLLAIFYAEENWRGHRDWENYKRTLEAQGDKIDWLARIPPPVPDDQNFAMAPFFEDSLLRFREEKGESPSYETNRINHLELKIFRQDSDHPNFRPYLGSWEAATNTDLSAWQAYYQYRPAAPNSTTVSKRTSRSRIANEFPVPETPQTPAQDVLLALSAYQDTLRLLRDASLRPETRFPISYEGIYDPWLPHLTKLVFSASYLQLRAAAQLANGQTNEAADSLRLIFYLERSVKSEPYRISYYVRLSLFKSSLNVLWEGLSQHAWTIGQLTEFQTNLTSDNLLADYITVTKSDRDQGCHVIEQLASSRLASPFARAFIDSGELKPGFIQQFMGKFYRKNFIRFAPRGWFEQNELNLVKQTQKTVAFIHPDQHRVDPELYHSELRQFTPPQASPFCIFMGWLSFWSYRPTEDEARGQGANDLGAVACALERYWLTHGSYPERLGELAPEYIAAMPQEIVAQGPLKYRRTDNGFYDLYSIGFSGKDVGVYRSGGLDYGNWVWTFLNSK